MEQFHVISLLGADTQPVLQAGNPKQARRLLFRKILKLHLRHTVSWLLRGAFLGSLFLLGQYAVAQPIGGALTWTAAALAIYLLWYIVRGHIEIHTRHQAKLYWLLNDAENREFSSNDPLIETISNRDTAGAVH